MSENVPPTLPGEVWRVRIRDTVCVVCDDNEIHVWWHGAWNVVPMSTSEREEVLFAYVAHLFGERDEAHDLVARQHTEIDRLRADLDEFRAYIRASKDTG